MAICRYQPVMLVRVSRIRCISGSPGGRVCAARDDVVEQGNRVAQPPGGVVPAGQVRLAGQGAGVISADGALVARAGLLVALQRRPIRPAAKFAAARLPRTWSVSG